MSTERDDIAKLLRDCELRLIDSRRSVEDAIDLVRRASEQVHDAGARPRGAAIEAMLDSHRQELVGLVLSALERTAQSGDEPNDYLNALVYRADENRYRVGRRQVGLTESEKHVLDLLWRAMPEPVSRRAIHAALYSGDDKANIGTIDVFVSNLRQKLKLASGGRDFIQSIRGQGWALKPEFCRNRVPAEDEPTETDRRRA